MNNGKIWAGIALVTVVAALALGGGWYLRHRRAAGHCAICLRPVHANARAVAEIDGKREEACCPACVLALRAQTRRNVRLLLVSDYDTRQPIAPGQATYVVGSDQQTCAQHAVAPLDEEKRATAIHYDRCEPSILAFGSRDRAVAFAREHGGNVGTLENLGMR